MCWNFLGWSHNNCKWKFSPKLKPFSIPIKREKEFRWNLLWENFPLKFLGKFWHYCSYWVSQHLFSISMAISDYFNFYLIIEKVQLGLYSIRSKILRISRKCVFNSILRLQIQKNLANSLSKPHKLTQYFIKARTTWKLTVLFVIPPKICTKSTPTPTMLPWKISSKQKNYRERKSHPLIVWFYCFVELSERYIRCLFYICSDVIQKIEIFWVMDFLIRFYFWFKVDMNHFWFAIYWRESQSIGSWN